MGKPPDPERAAEALVQPVHAGDAQRPFGEITADEAEALAAELRGVGSWGPLVKVAKVALAWAELAALLRDRGVASVAELEPQDVVTYAERLWVLAPEEGLI